jgi:AraC-like DNA-binding protein
MTFIEIKPSKGLQEYVQLYRVIHFNFDHSPSQFKAYAPRPEHCLQFLLRDPEVIVYPDGRQPITSSKAVLTGQHTVTNFRYVGKQFLLFQVVFQPGSLFRITRIEQHELVNQYLNARDVFGESVELVAERLHFSTDYLSMSGIIEQYLLSIVSKSSQDEHRVDKIAKMMLSDNACLGLEQFISDSCISHRQFDRKFNARIGISPKQYLQIIRFNNVVNLKKQYNTKDWLTIALECGYYDYQHLAKDFKEFTNLTPVQFSEIEKHAPERHFGEQCK